MGWRGGSLICRYYDVNINEGRIKNISPSQSVIGGDHAQEGDPDDSDPFLRKKAY